MIRNVMAMEKENLSSDEYAKENEGRVSTVLEPDLKTRLEPLWYVILHDDQLHTYDYVMTMLCDLFAMSSQRAFLHACEVDTQGVTIVARLPRGKAADKRDQIINYGGDPILKTSVSMKASIEPADD
jgi:ATP-dependent Clp protease adaptor protein ClpS